MVGNWENGVVNRRYNDKSINFSTGGCNQIA